MNPYKELGLEPGASEAEVKKAYRKMAAKHHPDKGGKEEDFKRIKEAYERITEPEKFQQGQSRGAHQGPHGFHGGFHQDFRQFFPIRFTLQITLEEAYKGCIKWVNLPGTERFSITLPPHLDLETGYSNIITMPSGARQQILVSFNLAEHATYALDGLDLHCSTVISLIEYYEGTTLKVTTLEGKTYNVKIAPYQANNVIRMGKKGYRRLKNGFDDVGDLLIHVKVDLPELTPEQIEQLKNVVQPSPSVI